jgi:hypothetical protein
MDILGIRGLRFRWAQSDPQFQTARAGDNAHAECNSFLSGIAGAMPHRLRIGHEEDKRPASGVRSRNSQRLGESSRDGNCFFQSKDSITAGNRDSGRESTRYQETLSDRMPEWQI